MNKELLKSVANKICTKTQEIVKKENIVSVPVSDYCIKISRNEFTDKEWKFLVENRGEKELMLMKTLLTMYILYQKIFY